MASQPDLDDYLDYIARLYPGQFGQSTSLALQNGGTQPVAPGAPAPPLPAPLQVPNAPAPIASGTSLPVPTSDGTPAGDLTQPSPQSNKTSGGLDALAKQLLAMAGKQGSPQFMKLAPDNTGPLRPLPLNIPKFGQGPTGA